MNQNNVYTEWQKLCDEQEVARDTYFQAFTTVNKKFSAIGQGTSSDNPSEDDLSKFEETWQTWEDVKKRMDQFVKDKCVSC